MKQPRRILKCNGFLIPIPSNKETIAWMDKMHKPRGNGKHWVDESTKKVKKVKKKSKSQITSESLGKIADFNKSSE